MVELEWITGKINEVYKRAVDYETLDNDFDINRDEWEKELEIKDANPLRNSLGRLLEILRTVRDKIYGELESYDSMGDITIEGLKGDEEVKDMSKLKSPLNEEEKQYCIKTLEETTLEDAGGFVKKDGDINAAKGYILGRLKSKFKGRINQEFEQELRERFKIRSYKETHPKPNIDPFIPLSKKKRNSLEVKEEEKEGGENGKT